MAIISECMERGVLARWPPPLPTAGFSNGVKGLVELLVEVVVCEAGGDCMLCCWRDLGLLFSFLRFCFRAMMAGLLKALEVASLPVLRAPPLKPGR